MFRLALLLHIVIGATLAGTAIVVALVLGYDTLTPILIAAGLGFLAAIPASVVVARALS
ncbi:MULTISPECIES: CTP synthetase [unclassified Meridianimarinicoccus]|uniref:CTP synthetase n=1 Tax=unclassified Meridianimarinicoccus TaxID=2923344 RepID=UPI001867370F|nr:CTP synthetase [Fluviibacterium sp. MJW13]